MTRPRPLTCLIRKVFGGPSTTQERWPPYHAAAMLWVKVASVHSAQRLLGLGCSPPARSLERSPHQGPSAREKVRAQCAEQGAGVNKALPHTLSPLKKTERVVPGSHTHGKRIPGHEVDVSLGFPHQREARLLRGGKLTRHPAGCWSPSRLPEARCFADSQRPEELQPKGKRQETGVRWRRGGVLSLFFFVTHHFTGMLLSQ